MASDLGNTFGFQLLYKVSGAQINKKEDVIILFVHWYLIKNGFKCLGIGDSKTIDPSEIGSELLPDAWNQAPNYTLRYIREGKLYILVGVKSEADLLLNLLRIEDHNVSNAQFPTDIVKELQGSLKTLIPTYEEVLSVLKRDLIEPVYSTSGREISTQTSNSQSDRQRRDDDDPLRVGPPQRSGGSVMPGGPRADPFGIGREDLDPFASGGSGMLFDPFSNRRPRPPFGGLGVPGRLPPGAIPPGARFDPFGPPDVGPPQPTARNPDADNLPPPGYDDMFM